ncbi:uncharacterized protein BX663DRAFT_517868 [Cokeromyces recurvatus]|uniref:uncharacterized protein n=1 Tax=Cokeromyces recurvatus TaxID=90255 RepID=UPI0022211AAC|nr:uncharacterized protein BX663DRAFT_517868 [Cokeromyces recurvatus]KAI7900505.1 hypothetical protein BX663DRAFT_517868 [Cokeromyces recurvatus]
MKTEKSPFQPYNNLQKSDLSPKYKSPSSESSSSQNNFKATEIMNTDSAISTPLKRKHSSPTIEHSPNKLTESFLRSDTFASDINVDNGVKWTKQHWKKLEEYYVRKNYDYEKAAIAFYYVESLITINSSSKDDLDNTTLTLKELWSKEHIIWRCKCLDTSTRFYGGVLPSERIKKRKIESTTTSPATNKMINSYIPDTVELPDQI